VKASQEARLRSEFTRLYPYLSAGEWQSAAVLADQVVAHILGRPDARFVTGERALGLASSAPHSAPARVRPTTRGVAWGLPPQAVQPARPGGGGGGPVASAAGQSASELKFTPQETFTATIRFLQGSTTGRDVENRPPNPAVSGRLSY